MDATTSEHAQRCNCGPTIWCPRYAARFVASWQAEASAGKATRVISERENYLRMSLAYDERLARVAASEYGLTAEDLNSSLMILQAGLL